jgi:hypothetical protein
MKERMMSSVVLVHSRCGSRSKWSEWNVVVSLGESRKTRIVLSAKNSEWW